VTIGHLGDVVGARPDAEAVADPLKRRGGILAHLLVADEQLAVLGMGLEGPLHHLGAVQPHARLPADERHPILGTDRVGAFLEGP